MNICSKCGKENQARYKFCLGCGAQLTAPDAPAPEPELALPRSPTPPAGVSPPVGDLPPTEPEPVGSALAPEPLKPGMAPCPSCGSPNPAEFVFCGNCGARLKQTSQRNAAIDAPAAKRQPSQVGKLSLIRPDGSEGGTHPLHAPETIVGRGTGPLFDNDSYLSPKHARLTFSDGQMLLEDAGSLNGVFVRITQEEPLVEGDIFRIGQELLRFDVIGEPQSLDDGTEIMGSPNPGYWGRVSIVVGPGVDGSAFPLMGDETVLGRERGDILFSDDGYVSGTHAKITLNDDG
ncbi:MAG: zinc ribbon domain-containing protein, partial [Deltaproteobacteria bacterium]|nr:zinc ribbon domain-containing protein [Deltaproteobacteria bacterium]